MGYADQAAAVEKGNMGQEPLIAGIFAAELIKITTKDNQSGGGETTIITVILDDDVMPESMASREVDLRFNTDYPFNVKRLIQLLMRAGVGVINWDAKRENRLLSKALKQLDVEEPRCKVAIYYAWDKQSGALKRSKKGYPITNIDVVEIDKVFKEYDPSAMTIPDTSKINFEQPSDKDLEINATETAEAKTPASITKPSKPAKPVKPAKVTEAAEVAEVVDPLDGADEDPYGI